MGDFRLLSCILFTYTTLFYYFLCFLIKQDQARCRDSRSTLSGIRYGGGGGVVLDYLGRPVIYNNSRRGRERALERDEENRMRVESYVQNSTMSLVRVCEGCVCLCVCLRTHIYAEVRQCLSLCGSNDMPAKNTLKPARHVN